MLVAGLGLALVSLSAYSQDSSTKGRKYKAPPPAARIQVTVVRNSDGKPIENAAVIFHPFEGDRDKGSLELKTNEDGKALIDVIPIGDTVRMQIIAKGYQTYGGDYKIDKDQMAMEIRMNRPGQQYSIYNNGNSGGDKDKNSDKPQDDKNPPQK
jgi:hypothetical protein